MINNTTISLVLSHKDLESMWQKKLPTPSDKGYPPVFDSMIYWVLIIDDTPCGYTGSMIIDNFAFVGNTYIDKPYRGKGLHSLLLSMRNNSLMLKDFTKITVLNPIEDSHMTHLVKVVSRLGYAKVNSYECVNDIMDSNTYDSIYCNKQEIWRKNCEH
tara:strand:- start:74 stop:547 length:474 start_codon:yes stop_codon:yes gene_type:complete